MNYPEINLSFQNLISSLTEGELKLLDKNIRKDGVRDPLVTWNGQLIDGHNRLTIIKKRKLPFQIYEMDFENEDQAKEWIILNQFGRRNLDNWQRGKLATKLESLFAEKAKANMKAGVTLTSNEARVHTSKELANISGLSRATIERVQRILSNATPQTITLLDKGEISISKAYENTQGRLLHNKEMERQNAMLSRMEAKVERGFASANKALIQIKESESYKEKCSTWDDYLNSSPFSHLSFAFPEHVA